MGPGSPPIRKLQREDSLSFFVQKIHISSVERKYLGVLKIPKINFYFQQVDFIYL